MGFSIGTSIGWGSLVVTCNTYLAQAGVLGTVIGLIIGMVVIMVVTNNLKFVIDRNPDAGGIYSYIRKACGMDQGFLAAWFLLLTYMSILWANITSVPLFMRYFVGDLFKFGFHYHIFGFEVYLGELILCATAIALVGLLCVFGRKIIHVIMVIAALMFVLGFVFCTLTALLHHGQSSFSFSPAFISDTSSFNQIITIAVISPWAFIGFENVAHFSEEYTFKTKKIGRILFVSVLLTTLVYLLVTLLSVTAYPPEYASWLDYIKDMGNLSGYEAVPAFYAIHYYLGDTGIAILMFALFGAILTSLIGNTMALSRLLYASGRDHLAPKGLSHLNKRGNPSRAVILIVTVSALIPFLGRTAIGWIVDVTTLGATIIYGLVSYAVYRDAKKNEKKKEKVTGLAGMILMIVFIALLLVPNLFSFSAMASESYVLFDLFAVIGLIYFRRLVHTDEHRQFGRSVLVWIVLLMLVLFSSMMWVTKETQKVTNSMMGDIHQFYVTNGSTTIEEPVAMEYLGEEAEKLQTTNTIFTVASFVVFLLSAAIILGNYKMMRRREDEAFHKLGQAEQNATTDQLTGIKNRRAYTLKENEVDARIDSGEDVEFAIAVCDVNNLKLINDIQGHKKGDECIHRNCVMICEVFVHSPVYRIGGDEFIVFLENQDYEHRKELVELLNERSVECKKETGTSLAVGISDYVKGQDKNVLAVFTRADELMYERKTEMKKHEKNARE